MKMKIPFPAGDSRGNALILVLCITAFSIIMLGATISRTTGTSTMNDRNNQYMRGLYAAEAATEKVFSMMKLDFLAGNMVGITNNLPLYRAAIPSTNDGSAAYTAYWNNYQFSDGQGNMNSNYVACTMSAYQLSTNWGPLRSQCAGLFGWTNNYRVVSNVRQLNSLYRITNACQLDVELDLVPVFQFAIFYNGLLEFSWCAPMTVNGRTHANGDIYTGSAWQLTFNSLATTTGTITSPAWDGHSASEYTVAAQYAKGYTTNWQALTLPIGTTNVHEIINMPPSGESVDSSIGQSRYFNKADLVLLVSNSTVTLTLKSSPSDPQATNITAYYFPTNSSPTNYVRVTTNFPWLSITNSFTDQREGDVVKVTDIDVSVLKRWMVTNSTMNNKFANSGGVYGISNVPNILYVADNRTYSSSQLTAVRLKNGTTIPTNLVNIAGTTQPSGFTVATPNPLYVQGVYNCPDSTALNTTNTTKVFPASLISDALTILSPNWQDSQSALTLGATGKSAAAVDTVNAAILTGIVASTGSGSTTFSGGVHNLPRLLEDWGSGASQTLTLNTSIVKLFSSMYATNQFKNPGNYYQAPKRQFSFDPNFLDYTKQPPGTPMLGYMLRSRWATPPPGTVTYAGN
jgi:hypothetical protein